MSKILYEVYKNDIKDSESAMYGKWYARLKSIETLSLTRLAKHIAEHGSVFTEDVVEGVLKKFKTCLIEMLLDSKKVKIAGLGTFYLTAECTKGGADKEEDFNVNQHLTALHIRFLPDQTAEDKSPAASSSRRPSSSTSRLSSPTAAPRRMAPAPSRGQTPSRALARRAAAQARRAAALAHRVTTPSRAAQPPTLPLTAMAIKP